MKVGFETIVKYVPEESRGMHYREDYPRRDDPSWLAWVKLKEDQGRMKLWKEPVPNEWWPDLSKPYEDRYWRYVSEDGETILKDKWVAE